MVPKYGGNTIDSNKSYIGDHIMKQSCLHKSKCVTIGVKVILQGVLQYLKQEI